MSVKNRLEVGTCAYNEYGYNNMHYIHPDSIYYAYSTRTGNKFANTISIANFSSEGELNFNYTLDLPDDPQPYRLVISCKALSNGGALICGFEGFGRDRKGFLILYHPPKDNVSIQEPSATAECQIYPNPAHSQLTVTNTENATIHLYNMLGQEVLRADSKEENAVVNIGFLPQGVYVLKVVRGDCTSVHKVVVND